MQKSRNKLNFFAIMLALLASLFSHAGNAFGTVKASEPYVFVSLGDNLSSGYLIGTNAISSYTNNVFNQFQTNFGNTVYFMEGIEGFTSTDLLTRLDNSILSSKINMADQIMLNIGLQDIYSIVAANYNAFITTSTITEATLREYLQASANQFAFNIEAIANRLDSNTKSETTISIMTVYNPYRSISNKNLGNIVNEYINAINTSIRNIDSHKFEIIDMKPLFDALNAASHTALLSASPNFLLNADGHAFIANQFLANMKVFQLGFQFSVSLTHEGELNQIFSQGTPVVFTLQVYEGTVVGDTVSWYVNNVLEVQGNSFSFSFTPTDQGVFEIKAVVDSYESTEFITVEYKEIDFLSLDFNGLLFQTLEFLEPIEFFISIPTVDPSIPINWSVDSNPVLAYTPDGLSYVFNPIEVGEFVVRVQRGELFSEKTVTIEYSPISDFDLAVNGTLNQTLGSTTNVVLNITLPTYSFQDTSVIWMVNGDVQQETSTSFALHPTEIGNYEVSATIGDIEKSKTVVVAYATIANFTLNHEGELEQQLNYLTPVVFSFSLPQYTDPNTVAQWSVNNVRRSQLTATFSYTATQVGTYVIEAKIGTVTKTKTITVEYVPIVLAQQVLGYNGNIVQQTYDLQPILFSVNIGSHSNANEVTWYVNNQRMQTIGREFWFQPSAPPDGEERVYYLVEARLLNGETSGKITVSVFRGGTKPIDFYGIMFITIASLTLLFLGYYYYARYRNKNLIV